jgi:uncharacterized membrane protein
METKETSRIEAFSDGIFAIAITLLILDIHVPAVKENESLLILLAADWATYLAFLIGFFTMLVCWINHHYMFEFIYRKNGMVLLLNGFKLLMVSFTPFATAVLSKYIGTPQQKIAVGIYTLNFFLMGLAMSCLWYYANRKGLTRASSSKILKANTRLYVLAPIISGFIFILSFVSVWICLFLAAIMFLIYLFPASTIALYRKETTISNKKNTAVHYYNTAAEKDYNKL